MRVRIKNTDLEGKPIRVRAGRFVLRQGVPRGPGRD